MASLPLSVGVLVAPAVAIESTSTTPDPVDGGGTATVTARLRNRTDVAQVGSVSVGLPAGWAGVDPVAFELAPGATADVPIEVEVPLTVAAGAVPVALATGSTAGERTEVTIDVGLPTPPAASVDHVDLGNGVSESAHGLTASQHSGTNVEAGLTRRYTHSSFPGGWFELDLAVPRTGSYVLRVVETFDGARRKTYDVQVDGQVVHAVDLARTVGGEGTITHQFVVPASEGSADGTVRVRFQDTAGDYDPSVADVWVVDAE